MLWLCLVAAWQAVSQRRRDAILLTQKGFVTFAVAFPTAIAPRRWLVHHAFVALELATLATVGRVHLGLRGTASRARVHVFLCRLVLARGSLWFRSDSVPKCGPRLLRAPLFPPHQVMLAHGGGWRSVYSSDVSDALDTNPF